MTSSWRGGGRATEESPVGQRKKREMEGTTRNKIDRGEAAASRAASAARDTFLFLSLSLSLSSGRKRERERLARRKRERERALGRGSAFGWRVHLRKMAAVARFAPRWILFSFSNEREREREGERSTCSKRDLDVSAHLQRNLHSLQQYRSRDIWIDSNIMDDFESVV